jgi:L-ascorbate metabolism protein UlaG (beta-lactamase superfamily)
MAMSATLKYHGHACFSMAAEGKRVIMDPFFTDNPMAVEKAEDIECDAVLVSHAHSDHLGDAVEIARNNNAVLVATYELAVYCQREGVENVYPMHIGGGHEFDFGHVKLTVAHHSSAIGTADSILGISNSCGVLVTMGERLFYYAGDTALCADIEFMGRLHDLDAVALPIGDTFTMGLEDAVIAATMLHAGLTVPMHYNTFEVIQADPHEFVRRVEAEGLRARVMEPGEEIEM